jgi:diguanylate cyclase (GGDEF)-like protein/PAS domain S-box-containing protein
MLRKMFASLRVRLILLTLVVLVPALGLLVYVADQERDDALVEVKSKALYLARLVAAEEAQIIQSTRHLLEQLAQTPEARNQTTRAACDEMVARQIKSYPYYDNLGVIAPSGIRWCTVLLPKQSPDLSSRSYFRRAVESRDFSMGDYQIGGSSGKASVGFGYPVLDASGVLRGVSYATLNLGWFGKSLVHSQLPPGSTLTVIDSQGIVLARFPDSEGLLGKSIAQAGIKEMHAQGSSGAYEGIGVDGIRRVWGFVSLRQSASGIPIVRVGLPVVNAYAEINRVFYRTLILIGALALLIVGAAWAGGERFILWPIKRLTAAARRLGEGDLSARTGLPHGNSEFGALAHAFDGMATALATQQEVSPDAILVVDEQSKIISFNRHFVELWGLPEDMVEVRVDEPVLQAVVAQVKDTDAFLARVKYLYEHSSEKSHEEIGLKDGRIIDRYTAPMHGENSKYYGRVWFFRDITERRQAEQTLIDERIFTNTLIASLPDPFCVFESTGKFVRWNDKMRDVLGLSDTQMAVTNALDTIYEADRPAVGQSIKQVFEQGAVTTEARLVTETGIRDFSLKATRADTAKGAYLVGVATDITERKRAEVALAAMSAMLQSVMDAATQISIIATDLQGLITVFNSGAERMLGYSAEETIGKQTPVIVHLESELMERGHELSEQFGHSITGFNVIVEFARQGKAKEREWTYVCKNGSHLTVSLAVTALRDVDGEPSGFLSVAKDITERKRADAELLRFATELDQRIFAAATANEALQRQTEESQRLNEERAALSNMNELLLACASLGEAFDIFGRAAPGLFESTGALHVYTASHDQLTPVATWGEWPGPALPTRQEDCWGLRRGNYYLGNGTSTPPCEHAGSCKVGATLCVPLMAYGEVLGVLHLRGPDASTMQSRLQLVTLASDGLALTLANIRLRQTLKEQAIRDPLTGLFNRRYLNETLVREFARAQRSGAPMAIVMIDVDHFKRFNDSFGHDAGDAVLQQLGSFFSRSVRADDIACRYGGEEFCLVLPQMDHFSARQRAEAIRAGAAVLEVKSDGRVLGPVTLSLGVALFPEDGSDMESLVRAADAALYEAKKAGRNRVEFAGNGE